MNGNVTEYLGIQEEVVRFDVSVDEAQCVDGVNGQHRLRYVESGNDRMTE